MDNGAGAAPSLKVLAVLDSTGAGGAETSTALMAPLLREMGIDFQIAFFHDRGGVKQRLIDNRVPIHVLDSRSRVVTLIRLIRLIRTLQPDVVHTAVYEADIIGRTAGWLCRVPVISSIINDIYGPEHAAAVGRPLKLKVAWVADVVTARFVKRFHAISHTSADSVAPRLHIPTDNITVIYRGRPMPRPEDLVATPEVEALIPRDRPEGRVILLAVGRQEYQKGFDVLVRALAILGPAYQVVLVGREGAATPELKRLVDELSLVERVHFAGERFNVPALMAAADLVVVPSRWEGLGGVLIEALSVGARCTCSDIAVFREIITGDDGSVLGDLFRPGDHRELAHVLSRYPRRLSDWEEPASIKLFQERYGLRRVADEMSRLYFHIAAR